MRSDAADLLHGGDASAEASRWVEDALADAREAFPDMPADELRGPLEQAFELASRTGRGEREFHAVFDAELRRAIEERDVLGSAGSVLSAGSSRAPTAFQAPAAAEVSEEPEPASDDEHEDARALGLAIGALRFHEGLSPAEIQDERGIGAEYYAEVMAWLLAEVDRTLDGDYPPHLDRERMARFAAGLDDLESSIAVDRHARECAGCAAYLADLLDGAVLAVEPAVDDATAESAHAESGGEPREPVMRVKAAELRKYVRRAPRQSTPSREPRRRSPAVRGSAFDGDWLPRLGRIVLALGLAVVVIVVAIDAGRGGSDGDRPAAEGGSDLNGAASALGETFPDNRGSETADRVRKRRQAAERARRRRAAAAKRAARERRAERARERAAGTPAPAPAAPAPAAPAPAPPAPAPAPSSQPSPPPSGEFGLEP